MTLPISSVIIRNALGYISTDISMIMNHLMIADSPNATAQQVTDAENIVKQGVKNLGKLLRTIEERTTWTIPATGYTNGELKKKGII